MLLNVVTAVVSLQMGFKCHSYGLYPKAHWEARRKTGCEPAGVL